MSYIGGYDPALDSWTTTSSIPTTRSGLAVEVYANKIYLFGGITGLDTHVLTLDVYDPSTNTWAAKASMPTARMVHANRIVNGKVYVIGGWSFVTSSDLASVEEYNPLLDP